METKLDKVSEKLLPAQDGKGQNRATKVSAAQIEEVTQILQEWSLGDKSAADRLMPLVYEELRRRAAEYLRSERPDHTLETTLTHTRSRSKSVQHQR